jgi:alkanesulfonate monooxygenase SsuD/methylene tetrahydromethanopterin reductase-like flavin-dependent oxidoreductase (luciferase family)
MEMDNALRFGTYVEFQCPPGGDQSKVIWDVIALGEHADQSGFSVWTCLEHDWFQEFAIMPDPLQVFQTLAQRTSNLTFRALCHTLPLHNPFVLAGQLALADILLEGRLEIGVGRGHAWLQEPANIVLEENVHRYKECLEILELALSQETFSYAGDYYRADELSIVPRPLQPGGPRFFQVGTSAKWLPRAAQRGYGIVLGGPAPTAVFREPARMYRQACADAGTSPYLGWSKAIYLDEDEDRAMEEARESVLNFIKFNTLPLHSLARTTPEEKQRLIDAGYAFYAADDFARTEDLSFEQLVELGIVFVGTPEKVGDQLMELWDEFRFEELLICSHYGGMERWQALKTQELFAREIMPRMRAATGAGAAV